MRHVLGCGFFWVGLFWRGITFWLLARLITKRSEHWFCTWPTQFSLLACLAVLVLVASDADSFGALAVIAVIAVVLSPPLTLFVLIIPFAAFAFLPSMLLMTALAMLVPRARHIAPTVGVFTTLLGNTFRCERLHRARYVLRRA